MRCPLETKKCYVCLSSKFPLDLVLIIVFRTPFVVHMLFSRTPFFCQIFLTFLVSQMQQIATDVSECIASIIFSSPDEDFREQCASIVDLPLRNLEEIENLIRMKMVKIIQRHDGFKKRKTGANDLGGYINELALDEDDNEPLYYDNENEEFL